MCAIAGILNFESDRPVDRELLVRMRDTMIHRGPDDCGVYAEGQVGLAARRLSIIDLVTGNQPIHNEDRSVWVVLNGEIYNFKSLRDNLERRGHKFYTKTDTEVLVHSYEELGPSCVSVLKGMFAFALWDARGKLLLLARDRMGEKPLHYYAGPREFIFGSELKSLLQHPAVPREIDHLSLSKYLTFQYVPAPHTIYRGIRKLQPGHSLIVSANGSREIAPRQYWNIPVVEDGDGAAPTPSKPIDAYAEEALSLLRDSVRSQLLSNVPVGVFLSGGIDSTLVAALAAEAQPGVQTFTIAFDEPSFDESRAAQMVAERIESEHHVEVCRASVMTDVLPAIGTFLDEPMADASILPTYMLSKFTVNSVKVALGGDGGDELFAGYPTFQALRFRALFRRLPLLLRNVVAAGVAALPVSHRYVSSDFKLRQFLRGVDGSPESGFFQWMGAFTDAEKGSLLNPDIWNELTADDTFEDVAVMSKRSFKDDIQKCLYLCAKLYLQDGVLVKVDRASMANSLEVRAPFLAPDLVEFAARCPLKYKMNLRQTKILLRRAARNLVPQEILIQRKKGFGVPIGHWILHDLRGLCKDYLDPDRIKRTGFFNPAYVQRILEDHWAKRDHNGRLIWTLLIFQLWSERWPAARVR